MRTKRNAKHYLSKVEERQLEVAVSRLIAVRNKRRNKFGLDDPVAQEADKNFRSIRALIAKYHRG